jgi:hypothetical protein
MFHCLADDYPSVKIALIGDSGVGRRFLLMHFEGGEYTINVTAFSTVLLITFLTGKSTFAKALSTGNLQQSPIYR